MRHRCARKELGSETHADVASVIQAPVTVEGKSKVFSLATGIFSPKKLSVEEKMEHPTKLAKNANESGGE